MAFIEIKNLQFSYSADKAPVLNIAELKIEKSEKIFLFGPSGAGKTTLLEILSGILSSQSGQVSINGTNLRELSATQRDHFRAENIGYIFQSFNLIPYLSVRENIELPLKLRGKKLDSAWWDHLVTNLGIAKILNSSVTEVSVGQQQRVAVARALLSKPSLLLADEPTSALDYDAREKFLKLLFDLCNESGTTVLFVSHDRSLQNLFPRKIDLTQVNRGQA